MGQLEGKVALITGGESGIGLAAARLFVAEGASVHLIGLDKAGLEAVVAELGSGRASASVADVADEDAMRAAIGAGHRRFGHLDIMLSNAGISGAVAKIVDYDVAHFRRVLDVHIGGALNVLKHGLPLLSDGGSVIITSSVAGLAGYADACAYVTAKHGQVGLMRTAAKEAAGRRIRVNTLHPGPTSTAFQDAFEMELTGQSQAAAAASFDDIVPLGRHTTPHEIAQATLYLASDASAMVTSTTFVIDGGLFG